MPQICHYAGIKVGEPCPKASAMLDLKDRIEEYIRINADPPVVPRLHVTSEACQCGEVRRDKYKEMGATLELSPCLTLDGKDALPHKHYRLCATKWNPPILICNKRPHKYMCCHEGKEPPIVPCIGCECHFGLHLHELTADCEENHECCYMENPRNKPGFKDLKPKHDCNYPNSCRAHCLDHYPANDYYNIDPMVKRDEC